MVRRAAGWHAQRPSAEDLRELAELLLEVAPDPALPAVVHELALCCRFAAAETASRNLIGDHGRRTSRGGDARTACRQSRGLPPILLEPIGLGLARMSIGGECA
jgi:hypothetical protein